MFNRWTYFEDVAAANTDNPQRDGTLHDYWTNSPTKAWVDPNATSWVLSYVEGTGELVLFPRADLDQYGLAQVSTVWRSLTLTYRVTSGRKDLGIGYRNASAIFHGDAGLG